MTVRTQITMGTELQRRARRRASHLGLSLAEYLRHLIAHDLDMSESSTDVRRAFSLGSSKNSGIARHKDKMVAEAAISLFDSSLGKNDLDSLRALRGVGKKVFRELGGGENFLRKERNAFSRSARARAR